MNKTLGVILIALGLFGLAWGGFTDTSSEKVVGIESIHVTRDKTDSILPRIAGALALVAGVVLWVTPRKRLLPKGR